MKTQTDTTTLSVVKTKHAPPPSKKAMIEAIVERARQAHVQKKDLANAKIAIIKKKISDLLLKQLRQWLASADEIEITPGYDLESWRMPIPPSLLTGEIRRLHTVRQNLSPGCFCPDDVRRKARESLDSTPAVVSSILANPAAVSAIDAHLSAIHGINIPKTIECATVEVDAE